MKMNQLDFLMMEIYIYLELLVMVKQNDYSTP